MLDCLKTFNSDDLSKFLESGAIFCSGNQVWMFWGDRQHSLERPDGPALCAPHFFMLEGLPWVQFEKVAQVERGELIAYIKRKIPTPCRVQWQQPSIENFRQQFFFVKDLIQRGDIQKAVPCVFEMGQLGESSKNILLPSILKSLQLNSGVLYGFWEKGEGILGLTPEDLIVQKDENNFETMALAGTCTIEGYRENPEAFEKSMKEVGEQNLVVRGISEVLGKMGEVTTGETTVDLTLTLAHLKTPIQFKNTSGKTLSEIIGALHPTPALGVYPLEKTDEVMQQLNSNRWRGRFGSPFGISENKNQAHVVVAIRNIQWFSQSICIGSGCGIVEGSDLDREWQELTNKRYSVKKIFGFL